MQIYLAILPFQTLNDWYDREIDAINEPYRPIPSGAISENEVCTATNCVMYILELIFIKNFMQVISQIWLLLLGGLGIAALLDVWVGNFKYFLKDIQRWKQF